FLIGTSGATAGKLRPTELTLDSSVAVGNGYWVDSGRMITKGCRARAVRLVGVRPDGSRKLLDWDLLSRPGRAWATRSQRIGFKRVVAQIKRSKRCQGDSVKVFPAPAP